jgi:hypothetical protein
MAWNVLCRWAGAIVVAFLSLPPPPALAQARPLLPDVLARAGRFVASFTEPPRRIVCRETVEQWLVPGIKSEVSNDDGLAYRSITSSITIGPASARGVAWYQSEGSGPAAWYESREVVSAGQLKSAGPTKDYAVALRFGKPPSYPLNSPEPLPRFAMVFLHPANQDLYEFSTSGESRLAGVTTWKVDFKEKSPLVPGTAVRGSFWIDPATGRVLKSEIVRTASPLVAEIVTTYEADRSTGLYLPSRIKERSAATEVLRVDTSGRITNCRAMAASVR